jgi:signal transduction histidine kinase
MQKRAPSLSAYCAASASKDLIEGVPKEECCERAREFADRISVLQAQADSLSQALQLERKARAAAEESSSTKDELLANVSHELRSPLTAILGWVEVLRREKPDGFNYVRGLEIIERNARAQEQLIGDLLDATRIKTGKLRLHFGPVELSSIIDSAIDSLHPLADSQNIRLQRIIKPKIDPVLGDPARLQQVMWNLLSNAIRFTPRGGCIMVQLGQIDSLAEIKVTDTGRGVSPDFLPYIFEPYCQPEGPTRGQGLGLGLAIVRQLVELHHGTILAESCGEGQGTSFTVRLPLMVAEKTRTVAVGTMMHQSGEQSKLSNPRVRRSIDVQSTSTGVPDSALPSGVMRLDLFTRC